MPKMKTKSGAKKRFSFTATGRVKAGVAGKRHRLISHNAKYIRTQPRHQDPARRAMRVWSSGTCRTTAKLNGS